jgi:hypothetical protein
MKLILDNMPSREGWISVEPGSIIFVVEFCLGLNVLILLLNVVIMFFWTSSSCIFTGIDIKGIDREKRIENIRKNLLNMNSFSLLRRSQ